jgi:BirA family biotin operon repressor/biotin-[acetyl-CoA-carboxylase] ligase
LTILSLKEVDSTQTYLKNLLKNKTVLSPCAVVSDLQTNGIGSRDNSWMGLAGNLFLSFSIELKELPVDLKLESASIYFAYILKETLTELGSQIWLKWPNDFYLDRKKVGGMITTVVENSLLCGIGLNLKVAPEDFAVLDIEVERALLLKNYFKNIEKKVLWKQVFSKYKLEFHLNQNFSTHRKNKTIQLNEATLEDDGSLSIHGERIYSLR